MALYNSYLNFTSDRPARNYFAALFLSSMLAIVFVPQTLAQQANGVSANTAPMPHAATITVKAQLVVIDVVVTDKAGKPVSNLTRKDFQVFEDNKKQTIRSFEPPTAHTLPATTEAAGLSAVFDPAKPASFGSSPITILVLDQLNTHFADSSFARRSMREYLSKQPALLPQPTTLLAVYDKHFKLRQGFTRDRDALLRALAATPTEYAWALETSGKAAYGPVERLDQSLRALDEIAESYARVPGRKNLIWVGGGFPTLDPTTIDGSDAQEVKDTLEHITDVLLATRITLYAVDPSSSAAGMSEITDATQAEAYEMGGDGMSGSTDPFDAGGDFDRLGPVTGGRVVRGRNDIAQLISSSVDLGDDFYTIAYVPTSRSVASSAYRHIRVVCLRPGLTATTRSGYYPERTTQETSTDTTAYDLSTAAESTIPLNGLNITVEPDRSVASDPESYIVHVGAVSLTWKPGDDGSSTADVAILAAYLSRKGALLGHTLHGMTAHARAGVDLRDTSRNANFEFTIKPVPKATTLRFVVRDAASGRMGSIDLPLPKH